MNEFLRKQKEQIRIRDAENRRSSCISRSDSVKPPPKWVLDKIADEKLSGRFNVGKNNLCHVCKEYKSVNGACACPE